MSPYPGQAILSLALGCAVAQFASAESPDPNVGNATKSLQLDGVTITGPERDASRGLEIYRVTSPFLGQPTQVDVLIPDKLEPGRTYPVLYALPVGGEWSAKPEWGNAIVELRKIDAANKYKIICVSMRFDSVPWYGSHATNPTLRHDDHLMKVVVPLIEDRYPVSGKTEDRLLIGFSKSGWGAVSLLLRHPDFFGKACSWDAPLMMTETNLRWGSAEHFGTPAHAADYVPVNLVKKQAGLFASGPVRMIIAGYDYYGKDAEAFHKLLDSLQVPHRYDNTLRHKHGWETGWVSKALELMFGPA